MRIKLKLCISMLAVSIATSAGAQSIDWRIFAEPFISLIVKVCCTEI